uniref:Prolactin receptor-like n=1 Tax=Cyprinodon variegatus TaxID=28743 RepID=A0A3Q2D4R6_CYPVA
MLCSRAVIQSRIPFLNGTSPPGKPRMVSCRSRDKETFFCWWEPGSDGGLPTTHRLYFMKERDYFANIRPSSYLFPFHALWSVFPIFLMLFSDCASWFLCLAVKPDPPMNVTVLANSSAPSPQLEIKWESPPDADIKSGWVTATYELRFKPKDSKEWKSRGVQKETYAKLQLDPGVLYMIQVRCKLDHGNWSEWTNTIFSEIPKLPLIDKSLWILVFVFSLIPLLATIAILVLKRKLLKQWFLPPVPGPKIRGIDVQLLKSGRSEDIANALITSQNFPPMIAWIDQVEDYLLVSDSDEWLINDLYLSQQKKKVFANASGLHLDSEIPRGEVTPVKNAREKAEDSLDKTDTFESSNESDVLNMDRTQLPVEKQECVSEEKASLTNTNQPLPNTCYVDIQPRETSWEAGTQSDYSKVKEVNGESILIFNNENIPQEVNAPDEYSRVKEVNSEGVFLQKHDSSDPYCKKKEDQYIEWINQKPKMPHDSELNKGFCLEMIGNGYVDSPAGFIVK